MPKSKRQVRAAVLSYPLRMSQSTLPRPDAEASQSPPAAHRDDSLATNPSAGLVTEDHPPKRSRGGWGRAGVFAVVACLAWLACPTAAFAQTTSMSVDSITGDGTVDALEKWNGFKITGNTGTDSGAFVTVTVNGTQVGTATSAIQSGETNATWSVDVPPNWSYITTQDDQPVVASSDHLNQANIVVSHERKFNADLKLPLVVNDVTGDNIINNGTYNIMGNTGPIGSVTLDFVIDGVGSQFSSELDGTWTKGEGSNNYSHEDSVSLKVTATKTGYTESDEVELTLTVDLVNPTVSYTAPSSLQVGVVIDPLSPTTSETIDMHVASSLPTGLTINQDTGVISGAPMVVDSNTITATVTVYDRGGNDGEVDIEFPEVVAGTLTLNVEAVAGDNTINRSEHTNSFAVTGNTGTDSGVTVTVTIGDTALTSVTSAIAVGATEATWSVSPAASAGYISEPSVELSVTATKTEYTSATVTRTLTVDLTAPTVSYTAPSILNVGEAIMAMVPTKSEDIFSYAISSGSLPRGLSLNGTTGVITGRPTTGNSSTETVGVLAADGAGNVDRPQIIFPAVDGPEPGVTASPTDLPVPEGGSAEYTLVLDTQPTHDVTINVNWGSGSGSDADLTPSPTTLTFTPANWKAEQTVTVSAAEDDDGMAGIRNFSHTVASDDSIYDRIPAPGVEAVEDDNDSIGVTVWPQVLRMPDGGSREYRVVLNTQPTDDVTITVTRDMRGDDDLTASPVTLIFTKETWDTPQTVTVSAAEDDDQVNGVAVFSHSVASNDENYQSDDEITIASVTAIEDETRPRVEIQTEASATVSGAFKVTIRFSEPVDGFELEDIEVSNGTASNFTQIWKGEYTVTITPRESGEVKVMVKSNAARDAVGNGNRAAEPLIIEADLERPVVAIASAAVGPVAGAFEVTITFNEAVTGFEQSDIQVTNGTVTDFSGSGTSYTAEITPTESGEVTVEVGAEVAEDAAGNGNEAAEPWIVEVDLERPVVAIASAAVGPVAGAFEVTITFNEAVTGFEQSDIQVTNGTVTDFSGSGTSYTAEITPTESGEVTVEVGAEVAEDAAGNGNEAAEPWIVEVDLERPVVAIASAAVGPVAGAFEVTITFNEAVTGFEQSDIQVTNGTVTDFSGSGTSYTAEITPTESGEVTVEVGAEVAEDAAGNGNRAAEPWIVEVDLERPVVAIASAAVGPVVGAFEVTITFNEAVTGFEQSDIQVTNGTVTDFSGSGTSYTAEITPTESGEVTVEVGAEVAEDAAGNGNRAAEPWIVEVDLERPVVAIASAAVGPVAGAFEVTITFSEAVTGFEQHEITVTNGSVTGFGGSGTSYTAEITPTESGEVTVEVGAEVAEDAAGNGNEAAEPWIVEVDLERPVVAIASAAVGPVAGAFEVTITFNEAVTGFEQSDIQVTNGTVTDFSGSGTSYTAEITPTESGEVTVEVGAEVAEDAAGNGNEAAEPWIVEVDLERPVVAIASAAVGPVAGAFEVTITFNEAVTGFEQSDIQVTNGTVTDFSGSGTSYTAEITPTESGEVTVEVGAEVAEDAAGNGNEAAAPFIIATGITVSYAADSYTATEGGEPVTVTVKLSKAGDEELAIPVRVTRPETTEVGDYQVEGLKGWDAEAGTGTLTYGAGETEQTFTIAANHDGDGDDETVELGIGELPEIVMAGEPAVAIVTLEDKGLVELEVRFGQAAYEVKEGEAAEIKVTVSPAADRRVELPLEVALQDGTTPEDYGGVPVSVVFESGESEGTISVEVLADEVNDPGEGIVLSLGALPEAVSAGDPASTEVHFGQRRTAEQFTSSLEAMLAVMGRSMGESAQTAIEGRFERHRQWSRLGSSSGAVSTPQPGRANRAAVLGAVESERVGSEGSGGRGAEGSLVEHAWGADQAGAAQTSAATGSDWNSEHRETGTPVSWLRNVVLGSFGNLARAAQSDSAMSTGYGMAPGGRVSGQDRLYGSGFGDARLGLGPEEFTGMRDQEPLPDAGTRDTGSAGYSPMLGQALNLSGASLEMSLGEGEEATSWVPVLWGQGDLQQFNGDLTRLGMNYGGGLEAAHLGLDLYANDKVLAGLSFMRSWGDLEYTDDGVAGLLESRMNTVHPYVYWQPSARLSVWGIGGLGQGQVEVEEPGRTHDFGAEFRMFAGGARAVLGGRGSNEWGVRADAFTTQLGTDALEDIAKVRGEAQRGRLMLEWVHDAELSVGRSLSLTAEAGGRIDRGDADRGAGMETGFRLGYLDAHSGLDVALHGRVLVVHESDYRDWGAGVQASWDPGEKQRGFRASVNSSLGQDGGGRTTLWDNADAVMRPAGIGAMGMGSQSRMESEVAYAGLKAPGLPGLLTPYGRLRRAGQGRELALGAAWSLTTGSQLALPATFELETIRRETSTGPADLALLAQMSIPF